MRTQENTCTVLIAVMELEDRELLLVEHCFAYLTRGEYHQGASENVKRSIRRKAKKLRVRSGEVFYVKRDGSEVHAQSLKGSIYC